MKKIRKKVIIITENQFNNLYTSFDVDSLAKKTFGVILNSLDDYDFKSKNDILSEVSRLGLDREYDQYKIFLTYLYNIIMEIGDVNVYKDMVFKFINTIKMVGDSNGVFKTIESFPRFFTKKKDDGKLDIAMVSFKNALDSNDIDTLLNIYKSIRYTGHLEYEKDIASKKGFSIPEVGSRVFNLGTDFNKVLKSFLMGDIKDKTVDDIINIGVNEMINDVENNPSRIVKSDAKIDEDKYFNDDIVLSAGDLIEIKKMELSKESYFSEIFGIYKSPKVDSRLTLPEVKNTYNIVINSMLIKFKNTEYADKTLDIIRNKVKGIMYDNYLFVPMKYIHLYWSNKGMVDCSKEARLSIRFYIKDHNFKAYRLSKDGANFDEVLGKDKFIKLENNPNMFNKREITC